MAVYLVLRVLEYTGVNQNCRLHLLLDLLHLHGSRGSDGLDQLRMLDSSRQWLPYQAMRLAALVAGCLLLAAVLSVEIAVWILSPNFPVHASGAVVVTGASSGIGEDAAGTIADRTPYQVFAGVRSKEDADRLTAKYPGIHTVFLDVTSRKSIAKALDFVQNVSRGVPLVALVNNAGVQSDLPIELQSSAADRFTFDVNVFGLLDTTRAFLPYLRSTGSGARIVNVGSLAGRVATAGSATYSASKFAVEGLTDSLRREVQPFGISVSILEPGYVQSRMGEKQHTPSAIASHYGVSTSNFALYKHVFDGFFATDRRNSLPQNSQPPATTTTAAILHAITSPTPKTRYTCAAADGLPAWGIALAAQLLPDRLLDVLV